MKSQQMSAYSEQYSIHIINICSFRAFVTQDYLQIHNSYRTDDSDKVFNKLMHYNGSNILHNSMKTFHGPCFAEQFLNTGSVLVFDKDQYITSKTWIHEGPNGASQHRIRT